MSDIRMKLCWATLGCLVALGVPGQGLTAQDLPAGVTSKMVSEGAKIFRGPGLCVACHGPEGKGVPGLGADLTTGRWLHTDGSYEGIVDLVQKGTTSEGGVVMPPKGGASLSEAQIRAVAAYVWSLSRGKKERPEPGAPSTSR